MAAGLSLELSSNVEKEGVNVASSYAFNPGQSGKGEATYSGQQFNTSTSTGETLKKGQRFTLLKRITNSKV